MANSDGSLSTFPTSIDTFVLNTEIQSSDLADIQEFEQLQLVTNKTQAQIDRYNALLNQYYDKIFTAVKLNKLQSSMINIEQFTKSNFLNYYKYCGEYNNLTTYNIFNSVRFNGNTYISLKQQTGVQPIDDGISWLQNSSKGEKGEKGVYWRGTYDNSYNYNISDIVYFNNSAYINIQACTGINPNNISYWQIFALKGTDGANLVVKGNYDNTVTYVINDLVKYNGSWYYAIQSTQGHIPTNTTYFTLFMSPAGTNAEDISITDSLNIYTANNVEDALIEVKQEADSNTNNVGTLSNLNTADNSSIVNAINEVLFNLTFAPQNIIIPFNNITVGNIILSYAKIKLGTITLS